MLFRCLVVPVALFGLLWPVDGGARDPGCPFIQSSPGLLNSERIARCFGSYGIELLAPVDGLRVARLFDEESGKRTCRTLAITQLEPAPADALVEAMDRIRDGASIGATLTSLGWEVGKRSIVVEEVTAGQGFRALAGLDDLPANAPIALQVYLLTARRGLLSHPVAFIAEFHHPDYLARADLDALATATAPGATEPEMTLVGGQGFEAFQARVQRVIGTHD